MNEFSATTRNSTIFRPCIAAPFHPTCASSSFFLEPGGALNVAHSQQNYLSANYTHVARELRAHRVNVLAHLIAKRSVGGELQHSLGSNPDVTLDLLPYVQECRDNNVSSSRSAGPHRNAVHGR